MLDGDAKSFRSVCAAKGERIISKGIIMPDVVNALLNIFHLGKLNEFTACIHSPMQGEIFCQEHLGEKSAQSSERIDVKLTRQKRKELGLDIDQLHEAGCRKKDDITVRKSREKTAGMIFAYRTCGISLGHLESIHAETCTGNTINMIYIINVSFIV